MAILKVAQLGHPVLRRVAAPVAPSDIPTPEFQRFCDDLLETMYAYDGLGLAAPQVHESRRVVVIQFAGDDEPFFLINPVVAPITDQTTAGYEGCLSVTGLRGRVERPDAVRVDALDRGGMPLAFEARGWSARVVQHECDHLDGVLYVDRAEPRSLAFLAEFRKHGPLLPADESRDDEEDEGDEDAESPGEAEDA